MHILRGARSGVREKKVLPIRQLVLVLVALSPLVIWSGVPGAFFIVCGVLLLAPGYLVERLLLRSIQLAGVTRLMLWIGLSLALVALVYQWATVAGLHITSPLLGGLLTGCLLAGVGIAARTAPARVRQAGIGRWWPMAALTVLLALTIGVRFVQIRNLALPPWVDPVHHALLVRIAAERGQLPLNLAPYLPVGDLPYHVGYHVVVAALLQLGGLDLPLTLLWSGQVLNALHVLTAAGLAVYLWRHPTAGLVAGLVVGLISLMPAFYLSWGRYTQLTGLLILPGLMLAWRELLWGGSRRWIAVVALLLAGLSLIHIRVLLFGMIYLAAAGLVWGVCYPQLVRTRLPAAIAVGGLALALAAPWLQLVLSHALAPALAQPDGLSGGGNYNRLTPQLLWSGQNRLLVALALMAALWGVWRRRQAMAEQVLWVGGLLVLANPWLSTYLAPAVGMLLALWAGPRRHWLLLAGAGGLLLWNPLLVSVPYLWLLPNDIVAISLFLPLSIAIGAAAAWLVAALAGRARTRRQLRLVRMGLVLSLSGVALVGAWSTRDIVNANTVFTSVDDRAALDWIAAATPADARFLTIPAPQPWLEGAYRGADGGWWITPLTGRWTSTPPVLFTYGAPDYVAEIKRLNAFVAGFEPEQAAALRSLIQQYGITHIYLGAATPEPLRAVLTDHTAYEPVYQQGGVTILAVTGAVGAAGE